MDDMFKPFADQFFDVFFRDKTGLAIRLSTDGHDTIADETGMCPRVCSPYATPFLCWSCLSVSVCSYGCSLYAISFLISFLLLSLAHSYPHAYTRTHTRTHSGKWSRKAPRRSREDPRATTEDVYLLFKRHLRSMGVLDFSTAVAIECGRIQNFKIASEGWLEFYLQFDDYRH